MWEMPRKKDISEDLRSRVVDMHRKGYRVISKTLDIHQSKVKLVI